jgi:hypothetical protein
MVAGHIALAVLIVGSANGLFYDLPPAIALGVEDRWTGAPPSSPQPCP